MQPIVAAVKPVKGAVGKPIAAAAPAHKPTPGEIAAKIAGKRAEDAANEKGQERHGTLKTRRGC